MTVFVRLLSLAGSCFENRDETQEFVDPRCLTTLKKVATFIWFVNAGDVVWKIETSLSNFNDVADDSDRYGVSTWSLRLASVIRSLHHSQIFSFPTLM